MQHSVGPSDVKMSEREVVVGLVQMSMSPEPEVNLSKAVRMIGEAAEKGAQVICLPELFLTPYFPQYNAVGGLSLIHI